MTTAINSARQLKLLASERTVQRLGVALIAAVLIAFCTFGALAQGIGASRLLFRHSDTTHPESTIVQNGIWAVQSGHLYRDMTMEPYTLAPYGPTFYAVVAGIAWSTGVDRIRTVLLGRVFVLLCFIAATLSAGIWARKLGSSRIVAVLAASTLLANRDFISWSVSVRPDIPAALLSLLGVVLVALSPECNSKRTIGAGALLALAFLTKQSAIAAPVALSMWLLWLREYRRLLTLVAAMAGTIALVLAALIVNGDPVIQNLLIMHHAIADPLGEVVVLRGEVSDNSLWLVIGAVGVFAAFRPSAPTHQVIGLYTVLAWSVSCASLLQSGGGRNYFLEPWIATALVVPLAITELFRYWQRAGFAAQISLGFLLIILAVRTAHHMYVNIPARSAPNVLLQEKLAEKVKGESVLSDVPYLAVQGRSPEFLDSYLSDTLEQKGIWSPAPIIKKLDQHQYDVVVLHRMNGQPDRWRTVLSMSPAIRAAVTRNYDLWCDTGEFLLFGPKDTVAHNLSVPDLSDLECKPVAFSMP